MVNSLTNFFYFKDNVGYFKHCIKNLNNGIVSITKIFDIIKIFRTSSNLLACQLNFVTITSKKSADWATATNTKTTIRALSFSP